MRASTLALLVSAAVASTARGQVIRPPVQTQPNAWTSFSIGFAQPFTVNDGNTGTTWQFGDAMQYRVSLEKPIQYQSTIGLTATFARPTLSYVPFTTSLTTICSAGCDATANVTQLLATFHAGGSTIGLHQVIDLAAGATGYWNFRETTTGVKLAPSSPDIDFSLGLGYGFGYTISPGMQLDLVQDFNLSVHQHTGLAGGQDALGRQFITRLGVRFALGGP